MSAEIDVPSHPLVNLRDLGGTAVTGGVLRPDRIWRSDDPSVSPLEEAAGLVERGLTDVVDLRDDFEYGLSGRGHLADSTVHHRVHVKMNLAVLNTSHIVEGATLGRSFARFYADLLLSNAPLFARIVEIVANAEGATLIHCKSGKDRTGVAVAAILALLGASDEDIAADYALTTRVIDAIIARDEYVALAMDPDPVKSSWRLSGGLRDVTMMTSRPVTMLTTLAIVRDEYGGVVEVLRAGGLTPEIEQRLRDRVVAAS